METYDVELKRRADRDESLRRRRPMPAGTQVVMADVVKLVMDFTAEGSHVPLGSIGVVSERRSVSDPRVVVRWVGLGAISSMLPHELAFVGEVAVDIPTMLEADAKSKRRIHDELVRQRDLISDAILKLGEEN